jgi:hypothetical protein
MNIILLSLFSAIIFGIIDALFFLLFEDTLQNKIKNFLNVDMEIAEIVTGAMSTAAAIFVASNIKMTIEEEIQLINNPLLDVSGVLLGTLVVVFTYIFYHKFIRCRFSTNVCIN